MINKKENTMIRLPRMTDTEKSLPLRVAVIAALLVLFVMTKHLLPEVKLTNAGEKELTSGGEPSSPAIDEPQLPAKLTKRAKTPKQPPRKKRNKNPVKQPAKDLVPIPPTPAPTLVSTSTPTTVPTPVPTRVAFIPGKQVCSESVSYAWRPVSCFSKETVLPEAACDKEKPDPRFAQYCRSSDKCYTFGEGSVKQGKTTKFCSTATLPKCSLQDIQHELTRVHPKDNGGFSRHKTEKGWSVLLDSCSLEQFQRHEILNLWGGKRIVLTGNAAMRQMFLKLVYHMRGMEWATNLDHAGPKDMYYTTNATSDVLTGTIPAKGVDLIENQLLEIIYKWEFIPDKGFIARTQRGAPDVQISTLFWRSPASKQTYVDYLNGAKQYAKLNPDFTFIFTPGTEDKTRSNTALEGLAKILDVSNTITLSLAAFSRLQFFRSTTPNTYMCWGPKPGKPLPKTVKVLNHKCKDYFNNGWWTIVLNSLKNRSPPFVQSEQKCRNVTTTKHTSDTCAFTVMPKLVCNNPNKSPVISLQCDRQDRCYTPGKGRIEQKVEESCGVKSILPRCTFNSLKKDLLSVTRKSNGPFSWKRTPNGEEVISSTCDLKKYTRADVLSVFKGKKVLFSGDSLTRQLFKKLLFILRGDMWEFNFELKGHMSFLYVTNDTHDQYIVNNRESPTIENQIFEMQFIWDPIPKKFFRTKFEERGPVDVHFASVGVWWNLKEKATLLDGYMEGASKYAESRKGSGYKFVFLPGTILDRFHALSDPPDEPRIARLERAANLLTGSNTYSLSMSGYSKLSYFPSTDGAHYMCGGFDRPKRLLQAVKSINELWKLKTHTCHDYYNGNLWTILLNAMESLLTQGGE